MSTPASVRRLSRVDLPALVYPTIDTLASPLRRRPLRWRSRVSASDVRSASSLRDPAHDASSVDLHLRLAAAEPRADAAALLGEVRALAASEARQSIAQQRELDLRLALLGPGVLAEDVEDHRGAVDRGAAEQAFEVELLGRGELVVEHDGVGVDRETDLLELFGFALADVPRVIGSVAALDEPVDDVGAGGVDQQLELVEAGVDGFVVLPG